MSGWRRGAIHVNLVGELKVGLPELNQSLSWARGAFGSWCHLNGKRWTCAWHGLANWGEAVLARHLSPSSWSPWELADSIISWTAWHSAAAAIGTGSRIRDAHHDETNRNGFFTSCVKDLVSHLQLSGGNIYFIHLSLASSSCSLTHLFSVSNFPPNFLFITSSQRQKGRIMKSLSF